LITEKLRFGDIEGQTKGVSTEAYFFVKKDVFLLMLFAVGGPGDKSRRKRRSKKGRKASK